MEQKDKCCFPARSLLIFYEMDFCVLMDYCISFGMNNEVMKIQFLMFEIFSLTHNAKHNVLLNEICGPFFTFPGFSETEVIIVG